MCYPDEAYDDSSSLADLYAAALRRSKSELTALVHARLTIDPDSLPKYYQTIFSFPRLRCYTLNVDDLESAVFRRFKFERNIISISAREREGNRLPGVAPHKRLLKMLLLDGDRGYATPKGVQYVVEAKGDVVVIDQNRAMQQLANARPFSDGAPHPWETSQQLHMVEQGATKA